MSRIATALLAGALLTGCATPKPGDCVFLEAGTVHAIGANLLLFEVQQTSDATFRLFDWNRCDSNGVSRTLHLEEARA